VLAPVPVDARIVTAPVPPIAGDASTLAPLFEKLARIARGANERVRIAVYGDSNMTGDRITGELRRILQSRFGDAGHGFVAPARPWDWYRHHDVLHGVNKDSAWNVYTTSITQRKNGLYGLGNISAESNERGARTYIQTAPAKDGDERAIGARADVAEIFYLKRAAGGAFSIEVDGAKVLDVDAQKSESEVGFARVSFPDGPHRVEAVAGAPRVLFFGSVLERSVPGVVVDSMGASSLNYEQLTWVEPTTRRAMLAHRGYDLVVFMLGTNAPPTAKAVDAALADFRAALPNAPIMLMSAPDRGVSHTDWTSDPALMTLATRMQAIAHDENALFWDAYAAMGGKGSMKTFVQNKLAETDCTHLAAAGGALIGARFASALMENFRAYASANEKAGCP
jgi:hypothetical protein